MMRVSLIVPSFYPAIVYGGPIFSTLHTSIELSKLQDIAIYVSTTNANMDSRLDVKTNRWQQFENNFFVKYYNETKVNVLSLGLLFNVWKDIKQSDVVHIQYIFSTPTPIALFYAKILRKPVVLSPRGALCKWGLAQGNRFKKQWLNILIKTFSSEIIWHATAQQEKDDILDAFPKAKVEVITNGVEYDLFQNKNLLSKKQFINKFSQIDIETDKIIVSMGRLQKKKGFDILIDSFVIVLKEYPQAKLFIAGDDEGEKKILDQKVEKLKLKNKVFFIGSISGQDKIDFLSNADLFVLPSHNENFGNVYIESLATVTPIVASTQTPWAEVEGAGCGKWVNNNVNETAQAIKELLLKDREEIRINAKEFSIKYNWKNIAIQFNNLFKAMKNKKGSFNF